MAPMTVETEPLADQQVDRQVEETEVRIFDGDDEAVSEDRPATNPINETDTGPVTAEELMDGATAQPADRPAVDEPRLDPTPPRVDHPAAKLDAAARLKEIVHANHEVSNVREQIVTLAGELKALKEEEKGLVARLMRLTAAASLDATRPIIVAAEAKEHGKAESASTNSLGDTTAAGDESQHEAQELAPSPSASSASSASPANAGDWRAYRFDNPNHFPALASQKAIVARLAENGIETIGQMVDFQSAANGGKDITYIKGIGSGKAAKIADAIETFWQEHPALVADAVDAS